MVKTAYKVSISDFKGCTMFNGENARYNLKKTIGVDMQSKQKGADYEIIR